MLSEAIIRGPQSLMRLFQLYTRDGRFEVQADALVPREPAAEGFALEPLLALPVAKLREKILEVREEVQRHPESEDLGALSEQVRFHLARAAGRRAGPRRVALHPGCDAAVPGGVRRRGWRRSPVHPRRKRER